MKRILLKLSGEALSGDKGFGFDEEKACEVASQIKKVADTGIQIGIVIGGGNFWRGRTSGDMGRSQADQIGMLATVMNCIYMSEALRHTGLMTNILTPFECSSFTKLYSRDRAEKYLEAGHVVFFAGGTGHPYFSTDTATALRAIEIGADMILLAKAVDGIYNADPAKDPDAKRYETISLEEVIDKRLQVMDLTASIMCSENHMPMRVFALQEKDSILRAVSGDFNGTTVTA